MDPKNRRIQKKIFLLKLEILEMEIGERAPRYGRNGAEVVYLPTRCMSRLSEGYCLWIYLAFVPRIAHFYIVDLFNLS